MKKLFVILMVVFAVGVYVFNTNRFQAFFFNETFYENIVDLPYDVLKKGERISIPLKYKYDTCYDVAVAVPGRELSDSRESGDGRLMYQFVSEGKILASGVTKPIVRRGWGGSDAISIRPLMVFDLPFSEAHGDVILQLEVVEPFLFMKEYEGHTTIVINPDYAPKFDKCYHEDLRIDQAK
ncbi:hypothetical protein [Pseudodesulfovibrio indicus]|uniref:hypothetical protein n=1 Tax=Pseudodesulfovibrio indicus TaxID=1716143 RepID=UPI00292E8F89|nr:hypothetical protein [Pseudodesulfovibrio indicus]